MNPFIGLGMGLLTGGLEGLFGTDNSAIEAQWAQQIAAYKQAQADQQARYMLGIQEYKAATLQNQLQNRQRDAALSIGQVENQEWLNSLRSNLGVDAQNRLVQMMQAQGEMDASGLPTGVSTTRNRRMKASEFGQQSALNQQQYAGAVQAVNQKNRELQIKDFAARKADYFKLATSIPNRGFDPIKPVFQQAQDPWMNALTSGITAGLGGFLKQGVSNMNTTNGTFWKAGG